MARAVLSVHARIITSGIEMYVEIKESFRPPRPRRRDVATEEAVQTKAERVKSNSYLL